MTHCAGQSKDRKTSNSKRFSGVSAEGAEDFVVFSAPSALNRQTDRKIAKKIANIPYFFSTRNEVPELPSGIPKAGFCI